MLRVVHRLPATIAAVALLVVAGAAAAAPVRTAHVEAELVSAQAALVPGQPLTVALRLAMDRGWHTYWQNPGDSGLPTTIAWKLPPGISAGAIQWPAPQALPVGPLTNYGYEGQVLLLTDLAIARDSTFGSSVTLAARADWLVCKETCIPEGADLALTLPVASRGAGTSGDSPWSTAIARTRAAFPQPLTGWNATATARGSIVDLVLTPAVGVAAPADIGKLRFFPYSAGQVEPSRAQTLTRIGAGWTLALPVAVQRVGEFTRVAGVLESSARLSDRNRMASIDLPLAGTVVASALPERAAPLPLALGASGLSLGVAIAFALVGGVLLNLMPCVFPVLSLKVLRFAQHGGDRASMRRHGLAFAGGVIVSFWLLAAALIALRAAGQYLGWGFQLQSPAVVAALALLFFLMALNLSGLFEIGTLLPSSLVGWNAKNPLVNDALSGVLAVVVASPCSAPFMGAALGYALTESTGATWLVFSALGIGMALPYLALAWFPGWRARLPRPGPWMLRLKQFLAFPLYATVIWLVWVLGAQLDNNAVGRMAAALLLVALALWAWRTMRSGGAAGWGAVAIAGIACAALVGAPVVSGVAGDAQSSAADSGPWQSYTPQRVAQLIDAGRPVFVDFTAAWCVTCQVNERLVLKTDAVQQAFAQDNVALVRADWTRRDREIGAALAALGRDGVPVYVLYRPQKEPLLLSELLTQQEVLAAIGTLRSSGPVAAAK
ncbi:MAG TPA: thioredoxin family protein [Casimicrobiaceae bacterium]|nr:thioredoxin family protein [Casimicrobiaceae bacterium]